jgi:hypothetical protein
MNFIVNTKFFILLFSIVFLSLNSNVLQALEEMPVMGMATDTARTAKSANYCPASTTFNIVPNQKTFMKSWTAYYPSSCKASDVGSWVINTQPKYGIVSFGTINKKFCGGDCSNNTYSFAAIYYTWTSDDPNATSDSFTATWSTGSLSDTETFTLIKGVPLTSINSVDLSANNINVTLSGLGSLSKSPLDIDFVGDNNTFSTHYNSGENVGDGTYSVSLNRPSIPEDKYTKIIAKWKLSTGDVSSKVYKITPAWQVLGVVRHSQYNTPAETACNGVNIPAWVFDTDCNFTPTTLNSKFASQTYINGTGSSIEHGIIKYSKLCSSSYPRGATARNSFLLVDGITGSCNKTMTNLSQAAYPNPKKVGTPDCGDTTVLVEESNSNKAIKQIQDYCPACKDGHHIDNYSDVEACSGGAVGDLGDFWTVNIGAK